MSRFESDGPRRAARIAGRVASSEHVGSLLWLEVDAPGWRSAIAGQFAMLQSRSTACFLPRAFSVAGQEEERVSFLIAPVGAGTRELERLRAGDPLWLTGPLGSGFDLGELTAPPRARIVVVAGGVGVAPFPLLLEQLGFLGSGAVPSVLVLLGFRDASQVEAAGPVAAAAARLTTAGIECRLLIATEDGTNGPPRLVTDLLAGELSPGDRLVACGAAEMSRAVWRLCAGVPEVPTWFSLEEVMACGVGSCHGCVVTLADGSFARVCHDGPVFTGTSIYGVATAREGGQ